ARRQVRRDATGSATEIGDRAVAVGAHQRCERAEERTVERLVVELVAEERGVVGGDGVVGSARGAQVLRLGHASGATSCEVIPLMSSITSRRGMLRNITSALRLAAPAGVDGTLPSAPSASRTTSSGSITPFRSPLAGWDDCQPGVRVEPGRIATTSTPWSRSSYQSPSA